MVLFNKCSEMHLKMKINRTLLHIYSTVVEKINPYKLLQLYICCFALWGVSSHL